VLAHSSRSTSCNCWLEAKKPPGTRPCAQSMRLLVLFCPSSGGARNSRWEEANWGAQTAQVVRWPHHLSSCDATAHDVPLSSPPKAWCAVTANISLTSSTPRRCAWQRGPAEGTGVTMPLQWYGRCHGADCLSRTWSMFDFNGVPRLFKLAPPWMSSSALLTDICASATNRLCCPPSSTHLYLHVASSQACPSL
jgi:hypothetical protein